MGDAELKGVDPTQEAVDLAVAASADLSAAPVAVGQSGKDNTEEVHLKRDREHTTVLVTGLPKGCTPERIENFFFEVSRGSPISFCSYESSHESIVRSRARNDHSRG